MVRMFAAAGSVESRSNGHGSLVVENGAARQSSAMIRLWKRTSELKRVGSR